MFGLTVLFILGLWVLITLVATIIGAKIGGTKGAIIGFMLTMGGWFVYWVGEYVYIPAKVSYLCKTQGGVTVYVTPEQWREQIGEEEWQKSFYTGDGLTYEQREQRLSFKGDVFKPISEVNQRVWEFLSVDYGVNGRLFISNQLLYDIKDNQVLYHEKDYTNKTQVFKFWLDQVHDCGWNSTISDVRGRYSSIDNANN